MSERRETGCAGWIGALSLGVVFGVLATGVGGPVAGIVVTVLVVWVSTRAFASTVEVPARDPDVTLNIAGETVRSLRGVLQSQGFVADMAPAGDEMIVVPLDVQVENFDALGGALGLADGSIPVLYRDAVTRPGATGVDVCALSTLAALVPKRGEVSAAPIGRLRAEDVVRWPGFLIEPCAVQVAMRVDVERQAWMLFRGKAGDFHRDRGAPKHAQ